MNQIGRKDKNKNLRFGQHKYECNFLLAASFYYFFSKQNTCAIVFLQRRCVRNTKTKQKTKQNKQATKFDQLFCIRMCDNIILSPPNCTICKLMALKRMCERNKDTTKWLYKNIGQIIGYKNL